MTTKTPITITEDELRQALAAWHAAYLAQETPARLIAQKTTETLTPGAYADIATLQIWPLLERAVRVK